MGITRTNGTRPAGSKRAGTFDELGTTGLDTYGGFVQKAYHTELYWPGVEPLYTRLWRSDPEVTIVRNLLGALSGRLTIGAELPEQLGGRELGPPTEDDERALEFVYSVLEDVEDGIGAWMADCNTRSPFYGWGVWEAVPGLRQPDWRPPDGDPWRSEYDDGLVGYRRLALRDYSSFHKWEMDDATGRVVGMWQLDTPNPAIMIPTDRSLHIRYGDRNNPEGLATLEAIWRLSEHLKGYEFIQGVGYEHTAGHVSVTVEEGDFDETQIRRAARALLSAQEGNYAAWPKGTSGEIIDTAFSAAGNLEVTKQNLRILKLALFGMQFVAISTMSGSGSYAALDDSSAMALLIFNSITEGNVSQLDDQLIKRLFKYPQNAAAFPNMTRRPRLTFNTIGKTVNLAELGAFAQAMNAVMPMGENDHIAIRRASELLPESPPEEGDVLNKAEPEPEPEPIPDDTSERAPAEEIADESPETPDTPAGEMARRVVADFAEWAGKHRPNVARMLGGKNGIQNH